MYETWRMIRISQTFSFVVNRKSILLLLVGYNLIAAQYLMDYFQDIEI